MARQAGARAASEVDAPLAEGARACLLETLPGSSKSSKQLWRRRELNPGPPLEPPRWPALLAALANAVRDAAAAGDLGAARGRSRGAGPAPDGRGPSAIVDLKAARGRR